MQEPEFHLDHFQGPMELLMHLLEKNNIDIYNIPISELTDQYLHFLDEAESMNLEITSQFLLMAAQLIRIKTKMLLPRHRNDEQEEDPRKPLIDQILAYKIFVSLAQSMKRIHEASSRFHERETDMRALSKIYRSYEPLSGLDPLRLTDAFKVAVDAMQKNDEYVTLQRSVYTIERMRDRLLTYCSQSGHSSFQALLAEAESTEEIYSLFLALLECIHRQEITVVQNRLFDDIFLFACESKAG